MPFGGVVCHRQNSGHEEPAATLNRQFSIDASTGEIRLEVHALGDLKRRDHAPLDLLPALSSAIASGPVFLRTVEMSTEAVVLAGLQSCSFLLES